MLIQKTNAEQTAAQNLTRVTGPIAIELDSEMESDWERRVGNGFEGRTLRAVHNRGAIYAHDTARNGYSVTDRGFGSTIFTQNPLFCSLGSLWPGEY